MPTNARSITMDDLFLLLSQLPVKIHVIAETCLTKDKENVLPEPGLKNCKSREDRTGGGATPLVSDEILFYEIDISITLGNSTYEGTFVKKNFKRNNDLIIGVRILATV